MNQLSIKLNGNNFLAWKREALGVIKERNLEKFINEADFGGRPRKFINGKVTEEYKNWEEQDRVLSAWLLESMSPKLSIQMLKCEHAFEVWKKIEDKFAKKIERAENSKLSKTLRSLADECVQIGNEMKAIVEELKEYGPASVADALSNLSMKPGTSGSA